MTVEEGAERVKEICDGQWGALMHGPISGTYVELDGYFYADDLRKLADVCDAVAMTTSAEPIKENTR